MKKNKFTPIDDILFKNKKDFFIDKPASISVELKAPNTFSYNYEGSFIDILGLSLDMINGIISAYEENSKGHIFFPFFILALTNYDDFFRIYFQEMIKLNASINIKINEEKYIDAEYKGSFIGYLMCIHFFIIKFCADYNIDPKEYYDKLIPAHKYFVETNARDSMNITILD